MKKLIMLFLIAGGVLNGQSFSDYRIQYDNFEENDERAFEFVNPYIQKAIKQKNYRELVQAYRDAVSFSKTEKLKFADSAISAALKLGDKEEVGKAYLTKGTVYYFNTRQFKLALDQYLIAWSYLKDSKDEYWLYKNLYHIGVVKNYLGHYQEALEIFRKCCEYYKKPTPDNHPNLKYNRKKGYLNSLNQMGICLIELSRSDEVHKMVEEGMKETLGDNDFYLERSYFYKLQGSLQYIQKKDSQALSSFTIALVGIERKKDFTNASMAYYMKGKILQRNQDVEEALLYFKKVDSVFLEHSFIWPASRECYEDLISYYRNKKNVSQELYYTTQLLKVDRRLTDDFRDLSGKMHKEYDTNTLWEAKNRLESSVSYGYGVLAFLLVAWIILLGYMLLRFRKKSVQRLQVSKNGDAELYSAEIYAETSVNKSSKLSPKVINEILAKLEKMEETKMYLEKGLTQNRLATKLKTNTSYLSGIINEYKGASFNAYINRLRVDYAKKMLTIDPQWRKFSIETLATECGFSNRSHFSKIFLEITGMSLPEFIYQLSNQSDNSAGTM